MVGEVKLSITRSWVENLSLPDERSNRETSCRIGFYSVYLVSLQGLPFTLLYFIYIDLHRHLFIHYWKNGVILKFCVFTENFQLILEMRREKILHGVNFRKFNKIY